MEKIKKELMEEAIQHALEHHNTSAILPVGERTSWEECFTHETDMIILWYDVELPFGRTTGIVTRDISNQ